MNKKRITGAALATALLFAPLAIQTSTAMADSFYTQQTNAERADITNWVANTTEDISTILMLNILILTICMEINT